MAGDKTTKKMIKLWFELQGSHSRIAKAMGFSREYVRQVLSPLGYHPTRVRKNGATDPTLVDKIKTMIDEKKNRKEILKDLKISASIYNRIMQLNTEIERPESLAKKPKYSNERLIELYNKNNGNYSAMARDLGVRSSFVSRAMKDRGLRDQYPSKHYREKDAVCVAGPDELKISIGDENTIAMESSTVAL